MFSYIDKDVIKVDNPAQDKCKSSTTFPAKFVF